jgi:hypothetical protein
MMPASKAGRKNVRKLEPLGFVQGHQDCGFDRRDLPIDLFEALSILTLQQRER